MLTPLPLRLLDSLNDRWVVADEQITDSQKVNSRILAMSLLLIGPHLPRLKAVAEVPESLLNAELRFPAGHLATAPTLFLLVLSLAPAVTACSTLAGVATRRAGLATSLLLIVGNSILYSVEGKIVHHQWTAVAIALMSWTLWSGRSKLSNKWSPRLILAWLLAWGLSTSAVVKVWGGWLNPNFSAVRTELEVQSIRQGGFTTAASSLRSLLGDSFLWEVADYGTVALELVLIVAVLRPAYFRAAVIMLSLFHLSILAVLGISFVAILPAYVPFVAELLPSAALAPRAVGAFAVLLGTLSIAALVASVPDLPTWAGLLSGLPVPALVAAQLLVLPALAIPLMRKRRAMPT